MISVIETALGDALGGAVQLGVQEDLGGSDRSRVLRCSLLDGPQGAPESVIVKQVLGGPDRPYNPDDSASGGTAWRFFNDWAGSQFLSEISLDPPLSPRFICGDRAQGFIVIEDLGRGENLADILLAGDPMRAQQMLLAFAAALGRMHAATVGRAAEYGRIREKLTGKPEPTPVENGRPFQGFRSACEQAGFVLPAACDAEIEMVAASMRDPGPFLAFTHGDPCPDNNICRDGTVQLFDFEFGAFRHALHDGVYGRVPFPTCWCASRIPVEISRGMEKVYGLELVKGCPEAGEYDLFRRAMSEAAAQWVLETMAWHLPGALKEDSTWGIATNRQRVLLRLDTLAGIPEEFGHLEALGAAAHGLAAHLKTLWPADMEPAPVYPAFRSA